MLTHGQQFFRIKAEFSIKERTVDGGSKLTIGTVFYDLNAKRILYDITFPEKGQLLIADSMMTTISNDTVVNQAKSGIVPEFSIFHLALTGRLNNYGFKDSFFKIETVEQDKGQVITTWVPGAQLEKQIGKVIMSNQNQQLVGIAFFSPDGKLLTKQIFRKYISSQGLSFPSEIIQITYKEEGESKQITTYRNLQLNELENDPFYLFVVPE